MKLLLSSVVLAPSCRVCRVNRRSVPIEAHAGGVFSSVWHCAKGDSPRGLSCTHLALRAHVDPGVEARHRPLNGKFNGPQSKPARDARTDRPTQMCTNQPTNTNKKHNHVTPRRGPTSQRSDSRNSLSCKLAHPHTLPVEDTCSPFLAALAVLVESDAVPVAGMARRGRTPATRRALMRRRMTAMVKLVRVSLSLFCQEHIFAVVHKHSTRNRQRRTVENAVKWGFRPVTGSMFTERVQVDG